MDKKQCERMFEQMQPPEAVVQPTLLPETPDEEEKA